MKGIAKIIAIIGMSGTMIAMAIADPALGILALIAGGLIVWGISAS